MTFQIHALPEAPFQPLFDLSDRDLTAQGMRRVVATTVPGFPCRVSLQDAAVGTELILLNHQHLEGCTPYEASHAIYVARDARQAHVQPGEVPQVLSRRLLSVRAFNAEKLMVAADVIDGTVLAANLDALFANADVAFVDIHNARQGCFAAKATRSPT